MSFAIVTSASAGAPSLGTPATTSPVDTTGSNLFVGCVTGVNDAGNVIDSSSNVWTALTRFDNGANIVAQMFYVFNPTTNVGQTFTGDAGSGIGAAVAVVALSGATNPPFDVESGAGTASGTTQQPGSVTPDSANEVLISFVAYGNPAAFPASVDSGFTKIQEVLPVSAQNLGIAMAYLIETSIAAKNPTWTIGASDQIEAVISTYRGTAPTDATKRLAIQGVG